MASKKDDNIRKNNENATSNDVIKASPEVEAMSIDEALEYLGLPKTANAFAIDEKFWQLSKNARSIADDTERAQREADLSCAYDIASGRAARRKAAVEAHDKAPKYLGKTAAEWQNFFHYNWFKILVIVVVAACVISIARSMLFKKEYDVGVVSLGHFDVDTRYMESFLVNQLGFENPFLNYVDTVVPNDQGESARAYSDQSAATMFLSQPELLVSDNLTVGYYFDDLVPLDDVYVALETQLPTEFYNSITPIYMSEREYHELSNAYAEYVGLDSDTYTSDEDEMENFSTEQHIIALQIEDAAIMAEWGYYSLWPETTPNLTFGIYRDCKDYSVAENTLVSILQSMAY